MPGTPLIITVGLNPAIDRVIEVGDLTLGAHQEGREAFRMPAGKALNVSRVLANLGVRSVATGFLGEENRKPFEDLCRDLAITADFFHLPGRTRENVTLVDLRTRQETHIRDVGLKVDAPHLARLTKKLSMMSRPEHIVIFSGSLPPGISPQDFAGLVDVCAAGGARVAVDTTGEALAAMAGKRLWLLKPNAAELSHLAGRELKTLRQQLQAAKQLNDHVEVILFTCGAEGAYLLTRGLALHGRAPLAPQRARNTVGCGDALLGAFVAGVWRKLDMREAFRDAVACASASACTEIPAGFEHDVMNELKEKVELAPAT